MPTKYKLTYFNGRGRAELSRMIFNAAGVKFEDDRVEFSQWPQLKAGKLCMTTNNLFNIYLYLFTELSDSDNQNSINKS
jgi:hypothetical protein